MHSKITLITGLFITMFLCRDVQAARLHVDSSRSSNGDGYSWATAYKSLADALVFADQNAVIDTILIARGTYYPEYVPYGVTSADNRDKTFAIRRSNLALLGGYATGGSVTRNRDANPVTLSGDIGTSGTTTDNTYHILLIAGNSAARINTIVLDGFNIRHGNSTSGSGTINFNSNIINRIQGAAISNLYASVTLLNCNTDSNSSYEGGAIYNNYSTLYINTSEFSNNSCSGNGGAIYNIYSSLYINTSEFSNNSCSGIGGVLYNYGRDAATGAGQLSITNCIFRENTALNRGGVIYYQGDASIDHSIIANCLFYKNAAGNAGGAISYDDKPSGSLNVVNCTFYGNTAPNGGVFVLTHWDSGGNIAPLLKNCLFWSNSSTTYRSTSSGSILLNRCITQDPACPANTTCTNVQYNIYPQFTDTVAVNFRLPGSSPAVNSGDTTGISQYLPATDLDGNNRYFGVAIDIGAYEYNFPNKLYVDSSRSTNGDGFSWATAFNNLSDALLLAHDSLQIDTILVAKGTYYPTAIPPTASATTNRDRSFYFLRDSLVLLGGYPSGGGSRNYVSNPTILSGDLDQSGTVSANDAYHVLLAVGTAANPIDSLVIDGITIRGGYANGTASLIVNSLNLNRNYGAGMYNYYASPKISNTIFSGNTTSNNGGGMYNYTSSPTISYCTFSSNSANYAGGIYSYVYSNPKLYNCVISGNSVTVGGGGILNQANSHTILVNTLLIGNRAGVYGAAIQNEASTAIVSLYNSTVSGNNTSAGSGDVYGAAGSVANIYNSIIYGNSGGITGSTLNYTYSLVQGLTATSNGNISGNTNPLFIDAPAYTTAPFTDGNYQLQFCSPVVNAGRNDSIPSGITTDITGNTRIIGTITDMGAYEKQSDAVDFENNMTLSTSSSNALTFIPTCAHNDWTYYADPSNPDSLSFAVNWGTNNDAAKAAATIQLVVDATNTFSSTSPTSARMAMKRYWNIDLNGATMNEPVAVRFYFNPADTLDMYNQLTTAGVGLVQPLQWVKTVGNTYSPDVVSDTQLNNGSYQLLAPVYGAHNNITYVQFNNITSFSGGTGTMDAGDAEPLPLNLLNFNATAIHNKVEIGWTVTSNEGWFSYEVERSSNARDWTSIYTTNALHATKYQTWDNAPYSGNNYYRLKAWSSSKDFEYGPTQKVIFKGGGKANINIYPNPNNGNFSIEAYGLGEEDATMTVQDMVGKTITAQRIKEGKHHFNVVNLGTGTYIIRIESSTTLFVEKMIVK